MKEANSLSYKVESKGPKQKYNEFVQLRGELLLELRKTVEIVAEGSSVAANHYVESIVSLVAYLATVGESLDGIKFWTEFDKTEIELLWRVTFDNQGD